MLIAGKFNDPEELKKMDASEDEARRSGGRDYCCLTCLLTGDRFLDE